LNNLAGAPFHVTGYGILWDSGARLDAAGVAQYDRPPNPEEVEMSKAWMRMWAKSCDRMNHKRTSYGLKHAVEAWAEWMQTNGYLPGVGSYISNGAFIQAALEAGYQMQVEPGSPNVCFNIDTSAAECWKGLQNLRA
jgi:hypothetical protein